MISIFLSAPLRVLSSQFGQVLFLPSCLLGSYLLSYKRTPPPVGDLVGFYGLWSLGAQGPPLGPSLLIPIITARGLSFFPILLQSLAEEEEEGKNKEEPKNKEGTVEERKRGH